MNDSLSKIARRMAQFAALLLVSLAGTSLGGCQNQAPAKGPEIHGDAGVRVQSRDTSRLSPEH